MYIGPRRRGHRPPLRFIVALLGILPVNGSCETIARILFHEPTLQYEGILRIGAGDADAVRESIPVDVSPEPYCGISVDIQDTREGHRLVQGDARCFIIVASCGVSPVNFPHKVDVRTDDGHLKGGWSETTAFFCVQNGQRSAARYEIQLERTTSDVELACSYKFTYVPYNPQPNQ